MVEPLGFRRRRGGRRAPLPAFEPLAFEVAAAAERPGAFGAALEAHGQVLAGFDERDFDAGIGAPAFERDAERRALGARAEALQLDRGAVAAEAGDEERGCVVRVLRGQQQRVGGIRGGGLPFNTFGAVRLRLTNAIL